MLVAGLIEPDEEAVEVSQRGPRFPDGGGVDGLTSGPALQILHDAICLIAMTAACERCGQQEVRRGRGIDTPPRLRVFYSLIPISFRMKA